MASKKTKRKAKRIPILKPIPIVVIGGGGHAKVLIHLLSRLPAYQILGYVDPRNHGELLGYPRLGGDDVLPELAKKKSIAAAIGVGKVKAGLSRMKMIEGLTELGYSLPPLIAPSAVVSPDARLGVATVILDGAVVQPGCAIGVAGIVNTNAVVDHDCVLGDDVHVGPGATLSGGVSVGDGCMVGVGSCLIQGVRVGADCTIGAGAAVVRDCMDPGTYTGVPARKARS